MEGFNRTLQSVVGRSVDGLGRNTGQEFGDEFVRGADGRLRNLRGQFVSQSQGIGQESGSRFGRFFGRGSAGVPRQGAALGRSFGKLFALGAGVIAAAGVGSFLKGSIDEAREAQKVGALTANVIKTTGGAAKISANQVGDLATALSLKTGVDDEAIQSGSNLLLTFKGIKREGSGLNDIFGRATAAAVDLSASGFGDINGASKQLGKALNDPVKGITALAKSGVTFTDQQKEQIKTLVESGDSLSAQKIILKELESQVGGAAAATSTYGEKASVAFGNIKEQVGTALLPVIDRVAKSFVGAVPTITRIIGGIGPALARVGGFIGPLVSQVATVLPGAFRAAVAFVTTSVIPAFQNIGVVVMPLVTQLAGVFTGRLLPALSSVGTFLTGVVGPAFLSVTAFLSQHGVAVRAVVVAVLAGLAAYKAYQLTLFVVAAATRAYAVVQGVLNAVMSANPIGIIIIALVALVAGLVYAYKNSDKFRAVVDKAFKGIKKVISAVINYVVPFVKNHWQLLLAIIGGPVGIIVGLIIKNFGTIKKVVSTTVTTVVATAKKFGQFASTVGEHVAKVTKFFKDLPGKILHAIASIPSQLKTAGVNIINGLVNGIRSAGQKVMDAVQSIINKIPKKIRQIMGIASPSKVTTKLGAFISDGLADGISSRTAAINTAARTATEAAGKGVETAAEKARKKAKAAAKKIVEGVRDGLRDKISGLQDDFKSLADSVSSAFTGNLFEATNSGDFINSLLGTQGQLQNLKAAFKTLLGYGLQPGFLSQLFASGNAGLILDLAASGQATASQAGSLFGSVTDLSAQLGSNVAKADVGPKLDVQIELLTKLVSLTGGAALEFAQEINGAVKGGKKRGNHGGKKKK